MKTRSTVTLCAFLFFAFLQSSYAQQYNLQSSSGSFVPIVGGTAVDEIENDQGLSNAIPIGFSFGFFGLNYTSVQATAEGFISFNNIAGTTTPLISNDLGNANYLRIAAPLWDDLNGAGGAASYALTGVAPNRVFTFEWLNWKWGWNAAQAGISFQVKLYETSNVIEYVFRPETGSLVSPSASCGLVGNNIGQFYSLTDLTGAAAFSPSAVNSFAAKPLAGQTFAFTPAIGALATPINQASNVLVSNITSTGFTAAWTNGSGSYHAVFLKQTAALETVPVADNTTYTASSNFGTFGTSAGSGWYCIYNGTGNSVNISGLQSGLSYRAHVVSYNGLAGAQKYLGTTAAGNPVSVITTLVAPGNPISTLVPLRVTSTQVVIDLNEGNGSGRAIFVTQGTSLFAAPVDNTTYSANLSFGAGSQIGNSGWFCVYNGASTSPVQISNLLADKDYRIHVVDYNGPPGSERYNISSNNINPVQVKTLQSHSLPTYGLTPSSGSFVPLVGANAVNGIETDDGISSPIPIGFTFRFAAIPFTQLTASSNGFLSFNPFITNSGSEFTNDLTAGNARPCIAPLWDDLSGSSGQASYLTEGTAPNRTFTFEWLNWKWSYNSPVTISFQVKLYEFDNKIDLIYRQEPGALQTPAASIGLAFPGTGSGNFISLSNASAAPATSSVAETFTIGTKPASGQVYSLIPPKLNQTISVDAIPDKFYGNPSFNVTATAQSGEPVSLESSNPNVASVNGSEITITGVGSVTITATQSGNSGYNAATPVQRNFIVNKGDQVINFSVPSPVSFGDYQNQLPISGGSTSGLPVTYQSSNPSVATVSGNTINVLSVGNTTITALQEGNNFYNAASPKNQLLTVSKGVQTISFDWLDNKFTDNAPFQLTATASSGLPVSYQSSNQAVATITGNTVTIVGAGFTDITASQAGNDNFQGANSVVRTLTVSKVSQTIEFINFPTINGNYHKIFGDEPFIVSATTTSGLPITFTSSNPEIATVSDGVVTINQGGTVDIYANQAGNNIYHPANAGRQLSIDRASQTIDVSSIPGKKIVGDAPFILQATASSGLPVSFNAGIYSNNLEINGNEATVHSPQEMIIYATQSGDLRYRDVSAEVAFCIAHQRPEINEEILNDSQVRLKIENPYTGSPLWYKDSELVYQGNIYFIVNSIGTYTVKLKVGENCESEISQPYRLIVTTLESTDPYISLFPNPVENTLHITLSEQPAEIKLVDHAGRTIRNLVATEKKISIPMENLPAAIYMLKIKTDNSISSYKIVKQ